MHFSDIIGQQHVLDRLISEAQSDKIPHALMLCGPEGCGALPIAVAFASYLLCNGKTGDATDACGSCSQCMMTNKLEHPDLHFSFPIYKKNGKTSTCDMFLKEWRQLIISNPYFGYAEWMDACGAENQQLTIYTAESDSISRKLCMKSNQGGYKVSIIWMPEKFEEECANSLLKLIEEPPSQTVFILVSERPDLVLQTIRSRTQMIDVPPLTPMDIQDALIQRFSLDEREAQRISRFAGGSITNAIRYVTDNSEQDTFFNLFVELMRMAYMRKVKEMKQWSDRVAGLGRERQKNMLIYCQRMIRENFIYNFHNSNLNYMNEQESNFAVKFAPFINERNVLGIMEELQLAQRDIMQNANPKLLFFDFALKMIVLIKNR